MAGQLGGPARSNGVFRTEKINHRILQALACGILMFWTSLVAAQEPGAVPGLLTGEQFEYTVRRGDSLSRIGARFGIEPVVLARMNGLEYSAMLSPGQPLQIDNRHLVPEQLTDGILINVPQRMLYYFQEGRLLGNYPVGLGRPDWPTPTGDFNAINLQENKTWYVPKSIQQEMQREGKIVQTQVPPGPDNPLGKHWIGLNLPGIGIHGTIAPASVYRFQSHGCIRMHTDDIGRFFQQVSKGQPGRIIYAPVLLAQLEDGRIFLEVHRDIYKKGIDPLTVVQNTARTQGLRDMINWFAVQDVIRLKEGLARDVGLPVPASSGDGQ